MCTFLKLIIAFKIPCCLCLRQRIKPKQNICSLYLSIATMFRISLRAKMKNFKDNWSAFLCVCVCVCGFFPAETSAFPSSSVCGNGWRITCSPGTGKVRSHGSVTELSLDFRLIFCCATLPPLKSGKLWGRTVKAE